MTVISDILFVISNGLLIPVMLLLLYFLCRGLLMIVAYFAEFRRRRELLKVVEKSINAAAEGKDSGWLEEIRDESRGDFRILMENLIAHRGDPEFCELKIANFEVDVKTALGKSRSLVKFGPMLGLMGTLIPMGPALVGLASGDLATMAYNMQVAFATTVVGMLVAAIGLLILRCDKRYYDCLLNDIDYIFSKLQSPGNENL